MGFFKSVVLMCLFSFDIVSAVRRPCTEVPCRSPSQYTVKWFLDNVKRRPDAKTCVFYSANMSSEAQLKTRTRNSPYISIWDMWDCDLYNSSPALDNPMRCIIHLDKPKPGDTEKPGLSRISTKYFEAMSAAMAMLCGGDVRSIHKDPHNISKKGIFWTVERRILLGNRNGLPLVTSLKAWDKNWHPKEPAHEENEITYPAVDGVVLWQGPRHLRRSMNGSAVVTRAKRRALMKESVKVNVFEERAGADEDYGCPNSIDGDLIPW